MLALRFIAFFAYLAGWLVFAAGAAAGAIPRLQKQAAGAPIRIKPTAAIGVLLQFASIAMITFRLGDGPLRPRMAELAAVAVLAPFGAALFVWALRSAPRTDMLATDGVYRWIRHPMYVAFLAMV